MGCNCYLPCIDQLQTVQEFDVILVDDDVDDEKALKTCCAKDFIFVLRFRPNSANLAFHSSRFLFVHDS